MEKERASVDLEEEQKRREAVALRRENMVVGGESRERRSAMGREMINNSRKRLTAMDTATHLPIKGFDSLLLLSFFFLFLPLRLYQKTKSLSHFRTRWIENTK